MTSIAPARSHPKVAARRAAVSESDERRKWRRTLIVLAALAVVAGVLALARSPLADVDTIAVDGGAHVSSTEVIALTGIEPGVPLIDVDLAGVEQRVARHPWVAEVEVTRRWPDTLQVRVIERVPVAASPLEPESIDLDKLWRLHDLDGRVLALSESRDGLPRVIAPDVEALPGELAEGIGDAVLVADALPDDLDAWVRAVVVGDDGEVSLRLEGGVSALLGSIDQLAEKLVAVSTLITRVQRECLESFDVQAPDAPVAVRCGSEPIVVPPPVSATGGDAVPEVESNPLVELEGASG